MTRHYDSDDLLAYLAENDAVVDLAEVAAHLEDCAECTQRLAAVRVDYNILSDPGVWEEELGIITPPPSRFAEYTAKRQAMEREAARADVVFADLATRPLWAWTERLAVAPEDCTESLASRMTAAARAEEESDPKRAMELLAIAESVAFLARGDSETAEVFAEISKERANALTMLGDYPAALSAIDRAERIYARGSIATFNLAFTQWARANVFFEMGRYAEALPLGQRAASVFEQFGDTLRESQVRVLIACVRYEQGEIAAAERLFLALLQPFEEADDRVTQARLFTNLACCRLSQGDVPGTELYAKRAVALYAEFHMETEIIRTRWALAKTRLKRGDMQSGIDALAAVAAEFQQLGMLVDSAEVELDILAELLRHRQFGRAAAIAARLHATFAAVEARVSAARALAHLHQATLAAAATPDLVRAVRHVLTHPEQPFVPPPMLA